MVAKGGRGGDGGLRTGGVATEWRGGGKREWGTGGEK